jgi:hypothetical protein
MGCIDADIVPYVEGELMRSRPKVSHWGWWLLGLLIVCSLPSSGASGARAPLPAGLFEVSPPVPLPKFSLPTLQGPPMEVSSLQGKIVVVRFWATW